MCNECFELFDDSFFKDQCPIFHCDGELVPVDSEIGWLIAEINKKLSAADLPIQTIFCCSGHYPNDHHAYIGFGLDECYFDTEEKAISYIKLFIEHFLKTPVDKLNELLSKSPYFTIDTPYKAKCDVLEEKLKQLHIDFKHIYRVFVGEFSPKYDNEQMKKSILHQCRVVSYIQNAFKEFLIDLIEVIEQNTVDGIMCED